MGRRSGVFAEDGPDGSRQRWARSPCATNVTGCAATFLNPSYTGVVQADVEGISYRQTFGVADLSRIVPNCPWREFAMVHF